MAGLKVIFMGSPDFALPALKALLAAGHDIVCVYSQPPRPAGRGHRERPVPVHAFASEAGLQVRTPKSLKGADEQQAFADLGADVAVVAAYGLLLPDAVLAAPRLGCINIHASLLPRWRGAAPIHWAILEGDKKTGITVMQVARELDAGDMLMKEEIAIGPDATTAGLHDQLATLGADMVVRALDRLEAGDLKGEVQDADQVTYARKITNEDGHLDWTLSAQDLDRRVRALAPKAFFQWQGERFRVQAATPVDGKPDAAPGTVLDDGLTVACGRGALRLDRLQRAGRSAQDAAVFLRGFPVPVGTVFKG